MGFEDKAYIKRKLTEIKFVANQAIEEAAKTKETFDEAINWSDLRCISARFAINEYLEESYLVDIEELSPNCIEFGNFIYNYIRDNYEIDLDLFVCMEW